MRNNNKLINNKLICLDLSRDSPTRDRTISTFHHIDIVMHAPSIRLRKIASSILTSSAYRGFNDNSNFSPILQLSIDYFARPEIALSPFAC